MTNHRYKRTVFILAVFSIGIGVGLFFNKLGTCKEKRAEFLSLRYLPQAKGDLTRPLLEIDISRSDDVVLQSVKRSLEKYINGCLQKCYAAKISVYLMDLSTRNWIGVNEDEAYSLASLLKTPIMIAYFKKAEEDPGILQKSIMYEMKDDVLPQNMLPENSVRLGSTHTIDDLIRYMIVYSDNIAMALLLENMELNFLEKVRLDLQLPPIIPGETERNISPKQFATPLQVLYNATYLNKSLSEKALKLLTQTGFIDGIVAGVPPGTVVAHKFAERKSMPENIMRLHDCGIVYSKRGPYLICIMTKGWNFTELKSIIQTISRIAYDRIEDNNLS